MRPGRTPSRRQALTLAGAVLGAPVLAAQRADAHTGTASPAPRATGAPECLADLVSEGTVTRADFMAR